MRLFFNGLQAMFTKGKNEMRLMTITMENSGQFISGYSDYIPRQGVQLFEMDCPGLHPRFAENVIHLISLSSNITLKIERKYKVKSLIIVHYRPSTTTPGVFFSGSISLLELVKDNTVFAL